MIGINYNKILLATMHTTYIQQFRKKKFIQIKVQSDTFFSFLKFYLSYTLTSHFFVAVLQLLLIYNQVCIIHNCVLYTAF